MVTVKGPKGELTRTVPATISVQQVDGQLLVARPDDERDNRALHGLTRSLVNNMVVGVTDGFRKQLEIVGVGYRAEAQGNDGIRLALGFSHPVIVKAPDGITFEVPVPTQIVVRGHRQGGRRPGRRRHPLDPQARALQGQGRPLPGREGPAQGREGRQEVMDMSDMLRTDASRRIRRHRRVRKKVHGTAERPRLAVFRSNKHLVAQVIDDDAGRTLAAASTAEADQRAAGSGSTVDAASRIGALVAERAKAAGVDQVVFDRGGFIYHGRVAALAAAARDAGLEF